MFWPYDACSSFPGMGAKTVVPELINFEKNIKCSKLPKTQNKPIKVFFNFSRGRSELRKISTGSYEELFSRGKIQVDLKIPNILDYNVC